jgi:CHAT domain
MRGLASPTSGCDSDKTGVSRVDETELRWLAMMVRGLVDVLISDLAEAERVDAQIARALALPEGAAKRALRAALSSHPAVRAWLREHSGAAEPSWRLADISFEETVPENRGPDTMRPDLDDEDLEVDAEPEGSGDEWDGGGRPITRGGLLGPEEIDDGTEAAYAPEPAADQPAKRFFLAELEDHPARQPLTKGEQYTIAFSVGPFLAAAIAAGEVQEDVLAAAFDASDVLALSVELDSDDFEVFGDSARTLRVPRTGRSLGKARFELAPRRDGRCLLVATFSYRRNFVHQLKLTIPVGGDGRVEVSARGRPPDSAVALEPRSISIWLEPWPDGQILCKVSKPVSALAHLGVTPAELALAVDRAHSELMKVISWPPVGEKVFQSRIDISADAQDMALRTLARAGASLFQRLFFHPGGDPEARRVGQWLSAQAMNPEVCLTVQVVADRAPLPWGMLYLGDASKDARLDWNCFLGMRHIVEQLPLQPSLVTQTARIPSRPELAVSLNVNTSIDDPAKGIRLVAGHRKRWMEMVAARSGLTLVSRSTMSEVVDALANAGTRDQVVYFYCHATASARDSQDPVSAAIIMGKDDRATLEELNLDAPDTVQLAGNPLVFINACESAELSPLFYNGFVPYFMSKGARGVIGTECKTPALFAVEWANAFFDRFLDGAPVGETVLRLRQDFLREHGNPLGLLYAVHCDADTRVAPALARARI